MKLFISFNLLILAIIIVRSLVEGKITRKLQYAMWLLLPIFLIVSSIVSIPVTVKVSYHTERALNHVFSEYRGETIPVVISNNNHEQNHAVDVPVQATSNETNVSAIQKTVNNDVRKVEPSSNIQAKPVDYKTLWTVIYVCGVVLMTMVIAFNNVAFAMRVRHSRQLYRKLASGKLSVYKMNDIKSPFLLGKGIYIPHTMHDGDEDYKFALCHELCHYAQGDSVWPIVEYALLVLFWFDPLIWAAHILIQRDSELAVDERVIELLGKSERKNYSQSLLDFLSISSESNNLLNVSTSMNGKSRSFIKCRVTNIMRGSRKSIAVTLVVAIFMAGIVGCSIFNPTPKSEARYITENTPWWNDSIVEYPIGEVAENYTSLASNVLYSDEFCYIRSFNDVSGEDDCTVLGKYAYDGSYFQKIDFEEVFGIEQAQEMWDYFYYQFAGEEYLLFDRYNERIGDNEKVTFEIDWESGALINETVIDKSAMPMGNIVMIFSTDDTLVYLIIDDSTWFTSELKYFLYIDDGTNTSIEEFSYSANDASVYLEEFTSMGDELCLCINIFNQSLGKTQKKCVKYNVSSGEYMEYDLPDVGFYSIFENEFYYETNEGIARVVLESGEIEDIIYFEDTYINNDYMNGNYFNLLWVSDEKIVLSAEKSGIYCANGIEEVITLETSEVNPNIGKALLTLAHVDMLPVNISQSVNRFNRENSDIFIEITDDYYVYPNLPEEWTQVDFMSTCRVLLDQMMVDISSGEGPDLVILDSNTAQLNDGKYLTDLSSYIHSDDEITSAEYVADILGEGNSEIYKLPFAITYNAITVKREYSEGYDTSLTYEEYEEFVSNNSLGNIFCGDRIATFDELFMASANQFFDSENNLTIDNEAFRKMAEFAKSMPEISSIYGYEAMPDIARYADYSTWISNIGGLYENYEIMAIPTVDRLGVTASTIGVGIAACCPLEQEAWEFCKSMLSVDSQNRGFGEGMPVNREAFENYAQTIVDEVNLWLPSWSIIGTLDPDIADYFLNCLGEVSIQRDVDSGVLSIINEELQAYYADQKTIDEVIRIIENRVNTMIDERG